MNVAIQHILLQILMVLFPIILYLALTSERNQPEKGNLLWGIACAASIGLSMLFSIDIHGVLLDIRLVPLFLSFLYGGTLIGVSVTAFTAGLRFIVGGAGAEESIILLLMLAYIIFQFSKTFHSSPVKKKLSLSTLFFVIVTFAYSVVWSVAFEQGIYPLGVFYLVVYIFANVLTVWLAIHLLETFTLKRKLVGELHRKEKMEIVGQLAASVAHEIRNPMTSVRGFIQILQNADNITSDQKNYLTVCITELDRANEIISDYLSLGKKEIDEHSLIEMDLGAEARHSAKSLTSFAALQNVALVVDINEEAYILGLPGRIRQMFINLIKNGIEASNSGGTVSISLHKSHNNATIFISDNGQGMDEDQIKNLGLPYYSTKEKGTGLGLMVTLQIITEIGGTWTVRTEKNKGTTFELSFPLFIQKSISSS
jgi:two-component system, sporulation sensor kinase B